MNKATAVPTAELHHTPGYDEAAIEAYKSNPNDPQFARVLRRYEDLGDGTFKDSDWWVYGEPPLSLWSQDKKDAFAANYPDTVIGGYGEFFGPPEILQRLVPWLAKNPEKKPPTPWKIDPSPLARSREGARSILDDVVRYAGLYQVEKERNRRLKKKIKKLRSLLEKERIEPVAFERIPPEIATVLTRLCDRVARLETPSTSAAAPFVPTTPAMDPPRRFRFMGTETTEADEFEGHYVGQCDDNPSMMRFVSVVGGHRHEQIYPVGSVVLMDRPTPEPS